MNRFIDVLSQKTAFHASAGVSEKDIACAEKALSLVFSSEYREYLKKYGVATVQGHEFTGIGSTKRLDVVENTLFERQHNSVPSDYYVIEQANIDGIVIWQSSTGEVYQTMPNSEPVKLCDSLCQYLEL